MRFERTPEFSGSRDEEGILKPAHCPECGSKKFGTLAVSVFGRYGPRLFKTFPPGVPSSDCALSVPESVVAV